MVTEKILDILLFFPMKLLDMLPVMGWNVNFGAVDAFLKFVDLAAYFLPMGTIVAIIAIIFAEEMFKIVVAFIKLVLKFIPFMG